MLYAREQQVAATAARAAGAAILKIYSSGPIAVDTKADSSPVTEADRAANALIVRHLSAAFPADAILSEESPDDLARLNVSRVWIVDPLDGTRDFVARTGDFCVHVALAVDGVPVVAVVFHVVEDALFGATLGQGAFCERGGPARSERTELRVSRQQAIAALRVGVSRTNPRPATRAFLDDTGLGQRAVRMGASVKWMRLAQGELDAVVNIDGGEHEWDTCAPELIVREAGGIVTDCDGRAFVYNQSDVSHRRGSIASNGACHAQLVQWAHRKESL